MTTRTYVTRAVRLAALGILPSLASAQTVPGPHHSWALVRPDSGASPEAARTLVRDSLIAALGATGIAPDGYPRPCRIVREPDPERPPGWFLVSCEELPGDVAADSADGVVLDPDDHYMALEVIDYPHARAFLLEIYLVPRLPYASLGSDARYSLPRVVLFHPFISDEWHPAIWSAIERGVAATGARRMAPERDP
ncbi:MAG: hypothetical protein GTO22_27460 [Gemmatimonadales bacterium]|nr:hypothetical protein [Gemmatimonadales bacterium]